MSTMAPQPISSIGTQRRAWECPRCNRINAPHVDQCSCSSIKANVDVTREWFVRHGSPSKPDLRPGSPRAEHNTDGATD